jgi:hexosaminidase
MPVKALLIPVKKYSPRKGIFKWPKNTLLTSLRREDDLPLEQLSQDLHKLKVKSRIAHNAFGETTLRIYRDPAISHPEAYRLQITSEGIEIFASGDAGAYYAIQTLRDLVTLQGKSLPACVIEDQPDFSRRGVYHDCARGKVPTVDTLKALIERLAHWKINELQLYIEDTFTFKQHPLIGKNTSRFTPEDILEIQECCKQHHIRFVGSLTSFGHMERILALPEYRHLAELPGFWDLPGGMTLSPVDPGSIKLVEEMYAEFVPLFEAVDFNVCFDEPFELGKGRSKALADRKGVGRVYLDFLLKVYRLCQKYGKRMNAWADIVLEHPDLLDELPKDIVMLNWDYEAGGKIARRHKEIAAAGLPSMVCPGTSSWGSHGSRLNNAIANVSEFAAIGIKTGAEGLLMTDWGDYAHRNFLGLSLHGFAHAAAHSWCHGGVEDKTFTETFGFYVFGDKTGRLARSLRLLGETYRQATRPDKNPVALNYALVEPFARPMGMRWHGVIDATVREALGIDDVDPEGAHRLLRQLSARNLWPAPPRGMDSFERLALEEFALAARMDTLACRRALIGQQWRAKQSVPQAEFAKLAAALHRLEADFKTLWMARNRPSRLRENLALLEKAAKESRRLAAG